MSGTICHLCVGSLNSFYFHPCYQFATLRGGWGLHDALRDELAPVFLQRLMEEQERYDRGILRVTPEMVPDTDPTFEDFSK